MNNNRAVLSQIISGMKILNDLTSNDIFKKLGYSSMFDYTTRKEDLKSRHLTLWNQETNCNLPVTRFEELIKLTEEGKLWKFPINNEQGLEAEAEIPFEDHVFLDQQLEDFPKIKFIQSFMQSVTSGLARNPWMTVARKHEIIRFYKTYFEEKKHVYENADNQDESFGSG